MGYHQEQEFYSFELRRDFNKLKNTLLPQVANDCPASRGAVVAKWGPGLRALQPTEHYPVL